MNSRAKIFGGLVECVLAALGLIALSPFLVLCAFLVRISSPGAIFFRQKRVGRDGKLFTLYKLRTMYEKEKGLSITAATDKRITPIGSFLRKYKLDELPQFYNVLRGDMSFVGPRPEVPEYVDLSNPVWKKVLAARPGITDPVTLQLRNEENFLAEAEDKEAFYCEVIQPFKLDGYQKYLEEKCLAADLKIIGQTVKVVLFPKTAPSRTADDIRFSYLK
jgi:lipopolysaccharide/colanic/teichoic acid biosynthesis glycosyltransferase